MKRTLIFTVILFLSVIVYAQSDFEPETYFGIKLGGNVSGIISDPFVSQKINPGLISGIVLKHISQKNLGIQIELNYKESGWNEQLDSTNTYKRRLNFIELPFMTHINLGDQKTKFMINFGPYLSYLLSEKEKIDLLAGVKEKKYYGEKINNKAGLGLCIGLGILRHTTIGLFQVESRISFSITDNFKNIEDSPFSTSKNVHAELSLSYILDHEFLKKRIVIDKETMR